MMVWVMLQWMCAVLQAGMSELAALCDWVTVSGLSDAAWVMGSTMRLAAICPLWTAMGKGADVLSAEQWVITILLLVVAISVTKAAHMALAALVGMCNLVLLCSPHICLVPFAHAALVAHRLDGVDDAAVGLCITVLSDLQWGLQHCVLAYGSGHHSSQWWTGCCCGQTAQLLNDEACASAAAAHMALAALVGMSN